MKRPAAVFTIALALGAIILTSWRGAQAQDRREEGPTEIKKCQTIDKPGSYKLVNNLNSSNAIANCLAITADFVTIDLGGFAILGTRGGTAIRGPAPSGGPSGRGITVRNGSIAAFQTGVDLGLANGSIVEGLHVSGFEEQGVGIIAGGIVKGNTVSGTFHNGIQATGTVTGNNASGNGFTGIVVGQGSTVIGNTATDNGESGISVTCPSNVTDNTAVNNGTNLVLNGNGCNNANNVAP
jgi:hypothetical protein